MLTTTWRNRIALVLLIIAAVGAGGAFVSGIPDVLHADPTTRMVELWRLVGFLVFAGLFGLLAWRPRHFPGVWELVMLHKGVLALSGILLARTSTRDAGAIGLSDGILALLLISAYILTRGYHSWYHPSQAAPSTLKH